MLWREKDTGRDITVGKERQILYLSLRGARIIRHWTHKGKWDEEIRDREEF